MSSAAFQRRVVRAEDCHSCDPVHDGVASGHSAAHATSHRKRKRGKRAWCRRLTSGGSKRLAVVALAVAGTVVWSGLVIFLYKTFAEKGGEYGDSSSLRGRNAELNAMLQQPEIRLGSRDKGLKSSEKQSHFQNMVDDLLDEAEDGGELEAASQRVREHQDMLAQHEAQTIQVIQDKLSSGGGAEKTGFEEARWDWVDRTVRHFLIAEDATGDSEVSERKTTKKEKGSEDDSLRSNYRSLMSLLRILKSKVNWSNTEGGRAHKKAKDAVVIGTASIIKRDFLTISEAYMDIGLRVEKASHLSAAVARGRIDGNLRSVRNRDWGVILCLSLNTEKCLSDADFARLESEKGTFSRINRFAGLQEVLWSKDKYCQTAQHSGNWLSAFTFPCWVLPKDDDNLSTLLGRLSQNRERSSWIVKPYKQGGGKGIFVLDTLEEVDNLIARGRKVVLQPYLHQPHLLESRKWDLRTYVLVTSVTPVSRSYLFHDGLVRLATEIYDPFARHGGNKTQYLTNTSINKKKVADMSQLTWPFVRLEETLGHRRFQLLFGRIKRAIGMLLVTAETSFAHHFASIAPDFRCSNCYHLLGVDLIVDQDLMPRVIEVNGEPSMQLSGESQSHYDRTKNSMQKEVARIVLKPLNKAPSKLLLDMQVAGLTKEEIEWISKDNQVMEYLLHLRREYANLNQFRPIYPDPVVCSNRGRRALWEAFLTSLGPREGNDYLFESRLKLHKILDRLICTIKESSTKPVR